MQTCPRERVKPTRRVNHEKIRSPAVEDEVNITVSKNMGKKYMTAKLHMSTLTMMDG